MPCLVTCGQNTLKLLSYHAQKPIMQCYSRYQCLHRSLCNIARTLNSIQDAMCSQELLYVVELSCAVAGQAASVLWRMANNSDAAKLELAKAGAVAPAVALLHRARADAESATQVSLCMGNCHNMWVALVRPTLHHASEAWSVRQRSACLSCSFVYNTQPWFSMRLTELHLLDGEGSVV